MTREIQVDYLALDSYVRRQVTPVLRQVGNAVRDQARRNVPDNLKGHRESEPEKAIVAKVGMDELGAYVDVGYDKDHPGFYLWWAEVGTSDQPAQPHLRPALRPGLMDSLPPIVGDGDSAGGSGLVDYTTRAGVTRQATQAQVSNWTRGSRTP